MSRIRLAIACLLLSGAALIVPATAYAATDTTVQAADIGWGIAAASTNDEPTAPETPGPATVTPQDIGWG